MTDQTPPPPYGPPSAPQYGSEYPQAFPPPVNPAQQGNGLALGSLITGIASLVLCGLGAVIGPVAVVLGIVSRKRSSSDAKAMWGIVTGAVGTLLSVVAIVSAIATFTDQKEREEERAATQNAVQTEDAAETEDPEPTRAQGGETVLTEDGVAAAGYPTAYAAYLDAYGVTQEFDGIYAGDDIDTQCFSMAGEAWWVTEGSPETCQPSSELWWEMGDGEDGDAISSFGFGGAGAAISFDALPSGQLMEVFGGTDLEAVSAYARDTLLPESGAANVVETQVELDGLPATQFDCTFEGLVAYRLDVVMLEEPFVLDDGTEIAGFIIHIYNEAEWVYRSVDVFSRLEDTLEWK